MSKQFQLRFERVPFPWKCLFMKMESYYTERTYSYELNKPLPPLWDFQPLWNILVFRTFDCSCMIESKWPTTRQNCFLSKSKRNLNLSSHFRRLIFHSKRTLVGTRALQLFFLRSQKSFQTWLDRIQNLCSTTFNRYWINQSFQYNLRVLDKIDNITV